MGFFKPAWQSEDSAKAIGATQKTTDQKKLALISQNAHNYYVRILAASSLTDKELARKILTEIAGKNVGYDNRMFAVGELRELIDEKHYNEIIDRIKSEMTEEEKEDEKWEEEKQKEFFGHLIDGIKRGDWQ